MEKQKEHGIIVTGEIVPIPLLLKFHEIIKNTGSRYTSNPRKDSVNNYYRVDYTTPDNSLSKQWNPILEEYYKSLRVPTKIEILKTKFSDLFKIKNR